VERYEFKIKQLKMQVDNKQSQIFQTECEIEKLEEDIKNLKELRARLPERHHFTWEQKERYNLLNELKDFIDARAKIHKRTPVAIASQIHHQKWLMHSDNFIMGDE
jgi:hypothetical protein